MNIKDYLKYYWLETEYLEKEVRAFFHKNHYLTPEHFLAIIVWKSNRSKTKVIKGIQKQTRSIEEITRDVYEAGESQDKYRQIEILKDIDGIGIPIASAILTVLYPDDFTVADYRVAAALEKIMGEKIRNPANSVKAYRAYINICLDIGKKNHLSLRNVDRALWGRDSYEGKGGIKELAASVEKSGWAFRE